MSSTPQITTAVSHDSLHIPLIDFSAFLSPDTTTETKLTTARAILEGFKSAGFIYLRNHGIPKPIVEKTFQQSAAFFARPLTQKDALAWTTPEANRGYVAQGREKVTDATDPDEIEQLRAAEGEDLKESLEIGREEEEGHPNHWPKAEGQEFKDSMLDFFDRCQNLHLEVMRAIAVGLGIEETWFDPYCDTGDNTLRCVDFDASAFGERANTCPGFCITRRVQQASSKVMREESEQVLTQTTASYPIIPSLLRPGDCTLTMLEQAQSPSSSKTWLAACKCSLRMEIL